jgi:hypothetical protein
MQLTDLSVFEVALQLIVLIHISFGKKTSFDPLGRDQSAFRLSALVRVGGGGVHAHHPSLYLPSRTKL